MLLGQQMTLNHQTNCTVLSRLNKARAAWNILKKRVFLDNEIKMKIKIDLFNAAIGSILKYGLSTLRTTETMDRKLQQFKSRCLREITYPNSQTHEEQENNEALRKKYCVPTFYSQLHSGKIKDIYRWKTTLAPAYLNNQQEMENELRIWEYNWYRMKKY